MDAPAERETDKGNARIDFSRSLRSVIDNIFQQNNIKNIVLRSDSPPPYGVYWESGSRGTGNPAITDIQVDVVSTYKRPRDGRDPNWMTDPDVEKRDTQDVNVLRNKLKETFRPGAQITGDNGQKFTVSQDVRVLVDWNIGPANQG